LTVGDPSVSLHAEVRTTASWEEGSEIYELGPGSQGEHELGETLRVLRTTRHEQGVRVAATRGSGAWMCRFVLMFAILAFLWLFASVAESRADDLATALDETSEVVDPDSSTAAEQTPPTPPAEETPPVDQVDPTPPAEETPPVDQVDPTPPAEETPPVDQTPQTPPVDPPVATPPTETPAPLPPPAIPSPAIHDSPSEVNPFAPTDSSGTTGDTWIPGPVDLLRSLGATPVSAAGEGGTSGADGATGPSDAQKSVSPGPSPLFPWAPQDKPFGGFGGGGILGGSTGSGGGGAPMVLAALMAVFAFAQLFGSRLSTSTRPLRGAAPAYQLKRPG
jgi:outer membrane biosynthesis protein TonB